MRNLLTANEFLCSLLLPCTNCMQVVYSQRVAKFLHIIPVRTYDLDLH